jgi:hypothetical protein
MSNGAQDQGASNASGQQDFEKTIGALWERTSRRGSKFWTGTFDFMSPKGEHIQLRIVGFPKTNKQGQSPQDDKRPNIRIYPSKDLPPEGDQQTASAGSTVPANNPNNEFV